MRPFAAVLCASCLAACATFPEASESHATIGAAAKRPRMATEFPEWHELQSEHFTLETDFDDAEALKFLGRLELLRAALLTGAWGGAQLQGDHAEVIAFRSHDELAAVSDDHAGGFTLPIRPVPLIVTAEQGKEGQLVVAHELAHMLSARFLPQQPMWLAEGLAMYLESLRLEDGDAAVVVGDVDEGAFAHVRSYGRMPSQQVLGFTAKQLDLGSDDTASFYTTSWLLVHYLNNVQTRAFRTFQMALARGTAPDVAWRQCFPNLDPDTLDLQLRAYSRGGQFGVYRAGLPPPAWHLLAKRDLPDAQGHAIVASLYLVGPGHHSDKERLAAARQELAPALAAAPNDARVLEVAAAWQTPAERLAAARRATLTHKHDPRAWMLLGAALDTQQAGAEKLEALATAARLAPDDPQVLDAWAMELMQQGRGSEAVEPARRAALHSPSPIVLNALALALASASRCAEAVPIQERAIGALTPEVRQSAGALLRQLALMKQGCGARP
jgi:tetratricopeptide (TPR) repeat protein